jgi:uncharacterized protein (DUF2147 family)
MRIHKTLLAGLLLFFVMAATAFSASAQKDKIEGIWYNEEKTSKIQIYKAVDGKFWGKIIWLKEPLRDGKPKTDIENPNKKMRNQPLINLPVLRGFKVDDSKTYDGGKIYDPKNGKTYSCIITWRNANELGIRGYVGVSMLGRTTTWTRAN